MRQELKADLWFTYHLYHKAPDLLGPVIARELDIPYWIAEASHAPKQQDGPWSEGHQLVAEALAQATGVFGLNPTDRGCVQPLLSLQARYIPLKPFLDTGPYRAVRASRAGLRRSLAASHNLDPEKSWILAAAMMRPGDKLKSFQLLAQSLKQTENRDWQLLIAGDGQARPDVEQAFDRMADIHFLGEIAGEDMPGLMAACDLMAWPGINEAFGLALLEAQACGLPVISANRPGIANMVLNGKTGLLVPEGEATEFAIALDQILDMPEMLPAFSTAALKNSRDTHDIQIAARCLDTELRS